MYINAYPIPSRRGVHSLAVCPYEIYDDALAVINTHNVSIEQLKWWNTAFCRVTGKLMLGSWRKALANWSSTTHVRMIRQSRECASDLSPVEWTMIRIQCKVHIGRRCRLLCCKVHKFEQKKLPDEPTLHTIQTFNVSGDFLNRVNNNGKTR